MSGGHHHADVLRWILDPLLTVPLGLALLLYLIGWRRLSKRASTPARVRASPPCSASSRRTTPSPVNASRSAAAPPSRASRAASTRTGACSSRATGSWCPGGRARCASPRATRAEPRRAGARSRGSTPPGEGQRRAPLQEAYSDAQMHCASSGLLPLLRRLSICAVSTRRVAALPCTHICTSHHRGADAVVPARARFHRGTRSAIGTRGAPRRRR